MRARRGFTLIEILTAVAMMVIVLPVAMYGVSISVQAASLARHRAEAATLAAGKLQELQAMAVTAAGVGSVDGAGDFGADFPGYKWSCVTSQLDLNMEQLDVRVSWVARGRERDVKVSTWVYQSSGTSTGTGSGSGSTGGGSSGGGGSGGTGGGGTGGR